MYLSSFVVCIFFAMLFYIYFLPQEMLDFFLEDTSIIYKNFEKDSFTLTFDDSPTNYTGEILDCLKFYNIKAIFFVLSDNIVGYEAIMDRIIGEGHKVANHGRNDTLHYVLSKEKFELDLLSSDTKLQKWLTYPKYFRPGFGFWNNTMLSILKKYKYKTMLGNIFPFDSIIENSDINVWYVKRKIHPGCIIILHDRAHTVSTLHKLLPTI